ncbi:hypothetical protein B0O80DRAFT_499501 [Mortierella sp. GBAus27b]|nr:hypothetical protein B0O80DRAFT_499501 [Mortierella sp. GBAus27b]
MSSIPILTSTLKTHCKWLKDTKGDIDIEKFVRAFNYTEKKTVASISETFDLIDGSAFWITQLERWKRRMKEATISKTLESISMSSLQLSTSLMEAFLALSATTTTTCFKHIVIKSSNKAVFGLARQLWTSVGLNNPRYLLPWNRRPASCPGHSTTRQPSSNDYRGCTGNTFYKNLNVGIYHGILRCQKTMLTGSNQSSCCPLS